MTISRPTAFIFSILGRKNSGFGLLSVLVIAGALIVGTGWLTIRFASARAAKGKSASRFVAENFNRLSILAFQTQWHRGHLDVALTKPDPTDIPMTMTTVGQALKPFYPPPPATPPSGAGRTWRLFGNVFEIFNCPPVHDYDPTPGVLLKPEDATDVDCIKNKIAVATRVRAVRLTEARATMIVAAESTFKGTTVETFALLSIPQGQTIEDTQCELKVSTDGVNFNPSPSIGVALGATLHFQLNFTPVLARNLKISIGGLDLPLTAAQKAASPLVLSHKFVSAGVSDVKILVQGGVPCEPSLKVSVAQPPATDCKWKDPNYTEPYLVDLCVLNRLGPTLGSPYEYRRGSWQVPVGISMGQPAVLAGSSSYSQVCVSPKTCRIRELTLGVPVSSLPIVSPTECADAKNGYVGGFQDAFLLSIFSFDSPGSNNCSFRVVKARNLMDGCLPTGTKVRRADGTLEAIEHIGEGDLLWNPILQKSVRVASITTGVEKRPLISLGTKAGNIRVTWNHPVLSQHGTITASEVRVGDFIRTESGRWQSVHTAQNSEHPSPEQVWNLTVEPIADNSVSEDDQFLHYISADGYVVGDWSLQSKLDDERLQKGK